jgi:CheY-like chemotaxis protein
MEHNLFAGFEILIAEDNFTNYFLLKELIDLTGAKHFWAKNGIEALDVLIKHENISLILMDVNMPEMDGITATRIIRKKEITIPIIFQTADANEEKRNECIMAGGNELLIKPINLDNFFIVLQKYLSNSYIPTHEQELN